MEPEAVAAGLVAGDDGPIIGQSEPASGVVDLKHEHVDIACRNGAESGLLARPHGEGELSGSPAQLEGELEHGCRRSGRIGRVGR
jgi:hypothetical protein